MMKRMKAAMKRAAKVTKLAKIHKGAGRLHTAGTWPKATYGWQGAGCSPTTLKLLRRAAAKATGIGGSRNCIASTIALGMGPSWDPAVRAPTMVLEQWIRMWVEHPEDRKRMKST